MRDPLQNSICKSGHQRALENFVDMSICDSVRWAPKLKKLTKASLLSALQGRSWEVGAVDSKMCRYIGGCSIHTWVRVYVCIYTCGVYLCIYQLLRWALGVPGLGRAMAGTGPCSGRGLASGPEFCLPRLEVCGLDRAETAVMHNAYACICIQAHVDIHVDMCVYIYTHICMYVCVGMYFRIDVHLCTYVHT